METILDHSEVLDELKKASDRAAQAKSAAAEEYARVKARLDAANQAIRQARARGQIGVIQQLEQEKATLLKEMSPLSSRKALADRTAAEAQKAYTAQLGTVEKVSSEISELTARLSPTGYHARTINELKSKMMYAEQARDKDASRLAQLTANRY